MKKCTRCRLEKPLIEYSFQNTTSNQLKWTCKLCDASVSKLYYNKNKDRLHEQRIKRIYKLNIDKYRKLLKKYRQCAICYKKPTFERLHVDHNHESNTVRGLLCGPCNRALGLVKEDTFTLLNMVDYIHRWL